MGAGAEALQERGQALLDYVRRTLNVPAELASEVEKRRSSLEGMVDEAIERTLKRLRLPSRRDIDRLNERLDKLTAEVQRAKGSALAKSPRRRKVARTPRR